MLRFDGRNGLLSTASVLPVQPAIMMQWLCRWNRVVMGWGGLVLAGGHSFAAADAGAATFRFRADRTAPLNADRGWAGAQGEAVTVQADTPFRLRFEVEASAATSGGSVLRLESRRNGGPWTRVEAFDFPYPQREFTWDFTDAVVGSVPAGWALAGGAPAQWIIAETSGSRVLRFAAGEQPVFALASPPWEAADVGGAVRLRFSAGARVPVSLVLGYRDALDHVRLTLDPVAGAIRVSRTVDGVEREHASRPAVFPVGEWLEVEFAYEGRTVRVDFQDGTVDFDVELEAGLPAAPVGLALPATGAVEVAEFTIEGEPRSPRVSIVASAAYTDGAPTEDLLSGAKPPFVAGAGVSLAARTPRWTAAAGHSEFEWPLVVRRYSDGAVTNEDGDLFEFRLVNGQGVPVTAGDGPRARLAIPPGHLGGTYVETPGRIGPWRARNGDLYFIMEPAESSNLLMMVKSTDGGRRWREVDGANRPRTVDLESVDSRQVGDTIHLLHQVTEFSVHHAFRTSDHPTQPDTWAVRDERAGVADSFSQAASLVVRPDGSMVAFHIGQAALHAGIRSPEGTWRDLGVIDTGVASPQAVIGPGGEVHVAYFGLDGTLWHRRLLSDNRFTPRAELATGAGTDRDAFGAILPLVHLPETGRVAVVYRLADGHLWVRHVEPSGGFTPAVRVSDRAVVTGAVDSQQAGADVVADGTTLHVVFIDEATRSLYYTHDRGGWQSARLLVDGIDAAWVRGNVYVRHDGVRVYGYVYDAGSQGGAGMNRYGEVVLAAP